MRPSFLTRLVLQGKFWGQQREAVWVGLFAGMIEALLSYGQLRVPNALWIIPLFDGVLFFLLIGVVNVFAMVLPQLQGLIPFMMSFLVLLDWGRTVFSKDANRLAVVAASVALCIPAGLLWHRFRRPIGSLQRRTTLWLAGIWLAALIVLPSATYLQEQARLHSLAHAAQGSPNVVVIVVDTLRADHLSSYGYSRPTSPNLDRLAASGVLFRSAVAPSSWTLPSHASMLTGLYPHDHHADTLTSSLGSKYLTIGEELQHYGYRTAAFSANTFFFCQRTRLDRGFIHFEGAFASPSSACGGTYLCAMLSTRLRRIFHRRRDIVGRQDAAEVNRRALRWIDASRPPFFVFLNYFDVHDPYLPPQPYRNSFSKTLDGGGHVAESFNVFPHLSPAELQAEIDAYDGTIRYVDQQVFDFMQQLRRRGLDKNTIVIVTSDHGEEFDEHGFLTHANALYWELIHVPLIVWGPGRVPAGTTVNQPVTTAALPATILTLVGQRSRFPGPSLARLWNGDRVISEWPPVVSELARLPISPTFPNFTVSMRSLVTPRWHYVETQDGSRGLYSCCASDVDRQDLSGTAAGKALCTQFHDEMGRTVPGQPVAKEYDHR